MARRAEPGKRRLILAAARDLFRRRGYTRTTMSQISVQSGIAHGTVYFYFDSKLAVADALVEDYVDGISRILKSSLAGSLGPEQIRTCVHKILLYASKNSDIARLQHVRSNLDIDNSRPAPDTKPQRILGNAIAEGIRRGRIREYDPLAAAELISGLVEWIVRICFVSERWDTSRIEKTAVQMLEYALIKS
jgi:AcrR family transcriptional regulator